jgi:hypothetical protein
MEDSSTISGDDSIKMIKKLPKSPEEPDFKGRPTDATFKKIKSLRIVEGKRQIKVRTTEKLDAFIEEWLKNDGNATEAAMIVFNCKSRSVAKSIGSEYLKKAEGLARIYMEKEGFTYGKMIRTAGKKMEISKSPEWWDRLMKLGGYGDFISKKEASVSVNILNAQKDVLKGYVQEVDIIEDGETNES